MDLVSPTNVNDVVNVLKKELMKSQEDDRGGEYRQLLVQAIHQCTVKFPDVAGEVVHQLIDYLGDTNTNSALDVVHFVREVIETYPNLRQGILDRLVNTLPFIQSPKVRFFFFAFVRSEKKLIKMKTGIASCAVDIE